MDLRPRLVDAGVVLLARMHIEGFFWGDCSLNNIMFRRDAGALMAYLVAAETGEHRPAHSDSIPEHYLAVARPNSAGHPTNLNALERVPEADVRTRWEERDLGTI